MFHSQEFSIKLKTNIIISIHIFLQIGTAAADSVTGLKLIEAGVKKESIAMLAVPLVPLQIILPLIISKFTAGKSESKFEEIFMSLEFHHSSCFLQDMCFLNLITSYNLVKPL